MLDVGHTPSTAGTFRKKFRKNSGKTPETLSECFLEFPSRVRLGCPKPNNSRHLRLPERFQNSLPPSTAGDASFFRSGSGEGLSEPVMEFPAVLGVFLMMETQPHLGCLNLSEKKSLRWPRAVAFFQTQRALRDRLMSRGKNCLPTVSRQFLTRNYPHPNCLLKCLPNCLSPTREGFLSSIKTNPAVRVIARQVRDKNCLAAIFATRHQSVSSGPLGRNGQHVSLEIH